MQPLELSEITKAYITPILNADAKEEIRQWIKSKPHNNAFHRVTEQVNLARCKNCGDKRYILVSFAKAGPFEAVPGHGKKEVITWFDGNENAGKGWYIVTKTKAYPCSSCQ